MIVDFSSKFQMIERRVEASHCMYGGVIAATWATWARTGSTSSPSQLLQPATKWAWGRPPLPLHGPISYGQPRTAGSQG